MRDVKGLDGKPVCGLADDGEEDILSLRSGKSWVRSCKEALELIPGRDMGNEMGL
jgi:hypothetical protein